MKVGLVGYGYWGPNLLRNLISESRVEVVGLAESRLAARDRAKGIYPQINSYHSLSDLIKHAQPDAVVIATPPSSHAALALQAIQAGAHVLIEKPLGLSVKECDEVLTAAAQADRKVVVDHTFAYHPAIRYLAEQISKGELGDLLSFDSVRVNFGGFQAGSDVVWDLAPHDLSILDLLTGAKDPLTVSAVGRRHFDQNIDNISYVTLLYEGNFLAHLHLNWVAPVKIRTMMITGSKKMAIYDENLPTEKVKLYDRRISIQSLDETQDLRVNYRMGDMMAPAIPNKEALATMISEFVDHVVDGKASVSNGQSGRRIVKILEAATLSMKSGGIPVRLSDLR